jgi:hypothetical protein
MTEAEEDDASARVEAFVQLTIEAPPLSSNGSSLAVEARAANAGSASEEPADGGFVAEEDERDKLEDGELFAEPSERTISRWEALCVAIQHENRIEAAYVRAHGEFRLEQVKQAMLLFMFTILISLASVWFNNGPVAETAVRGALSLTNAALFMGISLGAGDGFLARADDIFAGFVIVNMLGVAYITHNTWYGNVAFAILAMLNAELPPTFNAVILCSHVVIAAGVEILYFARETGSELSSAFASKLIAYVIVIVVADVIVAEHVFERNAVHKGVFRDLYRRLVDSSAMHRTGNQFLMAESTNLLYKTYRAR